MYPQDDLSDLERRLSAWGPSTEGLDADAMLFAAGRASVRRGPTRFVWPALTTLLAAVSVALGAWAVTERSGRLALTAQRQQPVPVPPPSVPVELPSEEGPAANSLLSAHRALEHGLDAWPPRPIVGPTHPPAPAPPVLQVGHRAALLDH